MKDAVVVIPSYNSAPWIVKLTREVLSQKEVSSVIIIDDSSPDGTAKLVQKSFRSNKKVVLIKREGKGGRGSAVIAGFKEALKDKRAEYAIEMDSDFAHDPQDIPRLIEACRDFDLVIGSRYLKGGRTQNYATHRKLFSQLANLWARFMLSIKITDYTSGFRCYRREALSEIDLDNIKTKGFITLSELAYKINRKGFRIGEVPISVVYHPKYKSNLNLKEIADAFISVLKIRLKN